MTWTLETSVTTRHSHHCGVIVLRIRHKSVDRVHDVLRQFLETTTQQEMRKALVIVDAVKYRARRG
jgi:deferrochelatase/peroxidase EfeB